VKIHRSPYCQRSSKFSPTHRPLHLSLRRIEFLHSSSGKSQRQRRIETPELQFHKLELFGRRKGRIGKQSVEGFRCANRSVVLGRETGPESARELRVIPLRWCGLVSWQLSLGLFYDIPPR